MDDVSRRVRTQKNLYENNLKYTEHLKKTKLYQRILQMICVTNEQKADMFRCTTLISFTLNNAHYQMIMKYYGEIVMSLSYISFICFDSTGFVGMFFFWNSCRYLDPPCQHTISWAVLQSFRYKFRKLSVKCDFFILMMIHFPCLWTHRKGFNGRSNSDFS